MTLTEHVEVIYCDDIRQEVGGKQSLMGVYSGDMLVSEMPLTIPKLGILVSVVYPIGQPFEFLEVTVERDGETILTSGKVPRTDIPLQPPAESDLDESANHHVRIGIAFMISPLIIEKATKLRVAVQTDRGQMRARALKILCAEKKDVQVESPAKERSNTPA